MLTTLIIFALVAVLFSFLCSLWESVLLSITPSYAHIQQQENNPMGRRLNRFKANIDRPLAAILTLNTIAHTVGAIGVGEQATQIWADSNPLLTGVVVPAAMTLAVLILSEIIPKTLGANYWKELAPFTVASLSVLLKLLAPLVAMTELITRALRKDKSGSVLSRAEFLLMAEVGEKHGVFEQSETEIIRNLLRFNTVRVKDVMTPRVITRVAPASLSLNEFHKQHPHLRFTRIPIHSDESQEAIIGYVRKDDVLKHIANGEGDQPLSAIQRNILVVVEAFPITGLFNYFIEQREHIALVVDEFGGMSGIVTLEDVIETMLGLEIVDELDRQEDMQAQARKSWERRAKQLGLLELDEPEAEAVDGESRQEGVAAGEESALQDVPQSENPPQHKNQLELPDEGAEGSAGRKE